MPACKNTIYIIEQYKCTWYLWGSYLHTFKKKNRGGGNPCTIKKDQAITCVGFLAQ